MTGYYRIYTHATRPQEFHQLLGFLILIGGFTYILGVLLQDPQLMLIGSGSVIMSSALSVCSLDSQRHTSISETSYELDASEEVDADA